MIKIWLVWATRARAYYFLCQLQLAFSWFTPPPEKLWIYAVCRQTFFLLLFDLSRVPFPTKCTPPRAHNFADCVFACGCRRKSWRASKRERLFLVGGGFCPGALILLTRVPLWLISLLGQNFISPAISAQSSLTHKPKIKTTIPSEWTHCLLQIQMLRQEKFPNLNFDLFAIQ